MKKLFIFLVQSPAKVIKNQIKLRWYLITKAFYLFHVIFLAAFRGVYMCCPLAGHPLAQLFVSVTQFSTRSHCCLRNTDGLQLVISVLFFNGCYIQMSSWEDISMHPCPGVGQFCRDVMAIICAAFNEELKSCPKGCPWRGRLSSLKRN